MKNFLGQEMPIIDGTAYKKVSIKDIIDKHNRICWYPSAGADFRVLMFLSEQYCKWKNVEIAKDELPTLFILTDCNPNDCKYSGYSLGQSQVSKLAGNELKPGDFLYNSSGITKITAMEVVTLPGPNIEFSDEFYGFEQAKNYGKAFYLRIHINSNQLGEWDTEVLYILTENTRFALDYLIPQNIKIDFLIKVRYGDAFGGSRLNGAWLLKLIKPLKVKYFLSNAILERDYFRRFDELQNAYPQYGYMWEDTDRIEMENIYRVDGMSWSNCGDIQWYKICTPNIKKS